MRPRVAQSRSVAISHGAHEKWIRNLKMLSEPIIDDHQIIYVTKFVIDVGVHREKLNAKSYFLWQLQYQNQKPRDKEGSHYVQTRERSDLKFCCNVH